MKSEATAPALFLFSCINLNSCKMQKEIWKDVPEYEGLYQVSNFGRVKSLNRIVKCAYNCYRKINERILTPGICRGYFVVTLSKNNKLHTYQIHQLVAISFLNHEKSGHELVIDHIDFNTQNNHLDNLQIISHRNNLSKDKFRKNKTSKYVGVSFCKKSKKWYSCIKINGKSKNLGYFDNEYDAYLAYNEMLCHIQILSLYVTQYPD